MLYLLALVERQVNNFALSTEALEKLVSVEPRNAVAQFLLGQNLQHLGMLDEAVRHWDLALKADPENGEALFNLAKVKAGSPEGKVYLERLQALQKNNSSPTGCRR